MGSDNFHSEAQAALREHAERTGQGYFNRKGAAEYVSGLLGRKVAVGSFHRMASDGTGPRYVMLLGHASYRRDWLDEWLAGLAREPQKRPRKLETLTQDSRQSQVGPRSAS